MRSPAHAPAALALLLAVGACLATYLETARLVEAELRTGRVNPGRLRDVRGVLALWRGAVLRRLLRRGFAHARGSAVSLLRPAIRRGRFAHARGSADYALAWGLVYWLLRRGSPAERARHRAALSRYLRECRRAFFPDPGNDFAARFAPSGRPCPHFEKRWAAWRARNALALFQALVVGPATSLEDWEEWWVEGLASLDSP